MPQMYPMSWLLIFLWIEFMLVLGLVLMGTMVLVNDFGGSKSVEVSWHTGIWLW